MLRRILRLHLGLLGRELDWGEISSWEAVGRTLKGSQCHVGQGDLQVTVVTEMMKQPGLQPVVRREV